MPEIIYCGVHRAVELDGVVCNHGEPVVFPAQIASRVLEQDCWTVKTDPTPPITTKKTNGS